MQIASYVGLSSRGGTGVWGPSSGCTSPPTSARLGSWGSLYVELSSRGGTGVWGPSSGCTSPPTSTSLGFPLCQAFLTRRHRRVGPKLCARQLSQMGATHDFLASPLGAYTQETSQLFPGIFQRSGAIGGRPKLHSPLSAKQETRRQNTQAPDMAKYSGRGDESG